MERILAASPFLCGIQGADGQWHFRNGALSQWLGAGHGTAAGRWPAPATADGTSQSMIANGNGGRALLTATPIPWNGSAATLYCGYEVSAALRHDGERRAALATTTRILDAFSHPVLTVDGAVRITAYNQAAAAFVGASGPGALGTPLEQVLNMTITGMDGRGLGMLVAAALAEGAGGVEVPEATLVRRDGAEVPVKVTVSPFRAPHDTPGAVIICEDQSDHQRRHSQLSLKARHDPLTGLINREEFTQRLARLLERSAEHGWQHSLCFMDLDQFKAVNDTAGHAAGDELLRQVTTALLNRVRGRDTLARIGGDEFAILLEHCPLAEAREVAEQLRQTVADFVFEWDGQHHTVGASIGLVPIGPAQRDAGRVVAMADAACYQAKHGGRNRVCVLENEDDQDVRRQLEDLRQALARDGLVLHVQPLVAVAGDDPRPVAREVLLRLPTGTGIAAPHELVPATRHRLNVEMDRWVLERLTAAGGGPGDGLPLLVNVSTASIQDRGFVEFLGQRAGHGPRLVFDLAEATVIEAGEAAARFCAAVGEAGWEVAIACRCQGPSALCLLEQLRPGYVTLDLRGLKDGDRRFRQRLATQLVELAHLVGATTVATHVEDEELRAWARELGFHWAQGYLLGRPEGLAAAGDS